MKKAIKNYIIKVKEYSEEAVENEDVSTNFWTGAVIGYTAVASILYIPACIAANYWKNKYFNGISKKED